MDLKEALADDEAQASAWHDLLLRYRSRSLLPDISREQFEAAMKIGFDEAWQCQRKRADSAPSR